MLTWTLTVLRDEAAIFDLVPLPWSLSKIVVLMRFFCNGATGDDEISQNKLPEQTEVLFVLVLLAIQARIIFCSPLDLMSLQCISSTLTEKDWIKFLEVLLLHIQFTLQYANVQLVVSHADCPFLYITEKSNFDSLLLILMNLYLVGLPNISAWIFPKKAWELILGDLSPHPAHGTKLSSQAHCLFYPMRSVSLKSF